MTDTHSIRLRGPWECEAGNGPVRRVRMPVEIATLIDKQHTGQFRCRRRFGCPTCLDPHERVWLVIERPAHPAEVHLNESRLGTASATNALSEFDITEQLRERNALVLDFDAASQPSDGLLFADVRLEIRD